MITKKVLLAGCVAVCCLTSRAQFVSLGVRGGISIPNLTTGTAYKNPINTGYKSSTGPDAGIFAEFKLTDVFSIQPAIAYSAQGGQKKGYQAFPVTPEWAAMFPPGQVPQYLYANFKSQAKINYLMVPMLAKFTWPFNHSKSKFAFFLSAGPFVSFLLSAKQVTTGNSKIYLDEGHQQPLPVGSQSFDNTEDIKSQLHSFNGGIDGHAGISYKISHQNLVFFEIGGNYGFFNIQKGAENGKNNVGAATILVGYAYTFFKK
ncbi:porin family protein [Danxiaibacter flavus]|uniref:Porin family protein n=1 Tax=Danxiaibacter flavus TaxID=3049108 RepID=A0ABV3Z943_9BACT|nr:porin family protein [Chitinophagaceae bacterium DXS]